MNEEVKGAVVTFRLTKEQYQKVDECALRAGCSVNDWCRKLTLTESSGNYGMTPNERLIYEQVAIIRHLIGYLLKGTLPPEEFEKLKQDAELHKERIAASLMGRSVVKREMETARRG